MSRINVLWLSKGLGPGGLERLLVSFAALADRDRFDIQAAYLLPWKDHLVPELTEAGVRTTCLDGPRLGDIRWLGRLRHLVKQDRIDIVHFHSPLMAATARPLLRALPREHRPALMGTEHNVWTSHRLATRSANQATLPLQAVTLAVSEEVRASMSRRRAKVTEVLIHGVDVDTIAARHGDRNDARARLGILPHELVVVTVANLRANKDYSTLLQAARSLGERGLPIRFLSVGQGPLQAALTEERDRLGLGDRFQFLGYQRDPIHFLVAADVFCLSSRYEGLPIALLEALAVGLPSVVTSVGGVPSVIRSGVEGIVVPPGSPGQLADAIEVLVDPTIRSRFSAAASVRARSYDIRRAVARQQDIYLELTPSQSSTKNPRARRPTTGDGRVVGRS